jgi:NitT/TauT family transport system substrate-binding protein
MKLTVSSAILAFALWNTACSGLPGVATSTPRATVTVATGGVSSDSAFYIGIEKGYFAEQGIDVQLVPFKVPADVMTAVATDKVDVGTGAPAAGLFNAMASGIPLKIVASNSRLEQGRDGGALVLRPEAASSVRTAADLKGKRLGIGALNGSPGEILYDRVLGQNGLSAADVELTVTGGFPETLTALGTGRIDGAVLPEPWVSIGVQQGTAVVWERFADIAPSMEWNLLVYSSGFATQRTDVARRFMVARLKAVRDYEDGFFSGRDRDELVSILTRYTLVTDPGVYQRMSFSEMDPDGRLDATSVAMLQDWYVAHGYVTRPADLTASLDPEFATFAVGVLGHSH